MKLRGELLIVLLSALLTSLMLLSCGGGGGGGGTWLPGGGGGTTPGGTYSWPSPGEFKAPTGNKWTIMVYLNADNTLDDAALPDLNEMVDAGGSQNGVNVVVLMDKQNEPATLHFIEPGSYFDVDYLNYCDSDTCRNMGELDMGDPNVLKDFVSWAMDYYPADNYMLIIWNHGNGWKLRRVGGSSSDSIFKQISFDDTSGSYMTIYQLRDALASLAAEGKRVNVLGFDACLMGTIEVVYNLKEYADYIVASEMTEPGSGWDYNFISEAINNPSITPLQLSQQILSYYAAYNDAADQPYTLAVIDTSKVANVASAISTLADTMLLNDAAVNPNAISNAFSQGLYDPALDGLPYTTMKDLATVLQALANSTELSSATTTEANNALNTYNSSNLVVNFVSSSGFSSASGLTIYAPTLDEPYDGYYYSNDSWYPFAADTKWDDMLDVYHR